VTRIRATVTPDPLAATAPLAAHAARELRARAASDGGSNEARLDPEQTAPFAAVNDDSGDLGKIAFNGRINLPRESLPPENIRRSQPPPPLPPLPTEANQSSEVPTPPVAAVVEGASPLADLFPAQMTPPESGVSPLTLADFPPLPPRPIPRPDTEKKISTFPTVPAPALEPEVPVVGAPVAAGAPAIVAPPPEPSAPALPPMTERSPEAVEPSVDPRPQGTRSSPPISRANQPPYVQSSLPEAPPARSRWVAIAVAVLVLGGTSAYLLRGEPEAPVATAPVASTLVTAQHAAPSATSPSSAPSAAPSASSASPPSVASSASSAPVASAAPSASSVAAAPSATPSSVASAAPSASAPPPPPEVAAKPAPPPPPEATTKPAVAEAADQGELDLPASAAGHRIFVDGKVAGEGTAPIHLHCGSHLVHVGSAGVEKKIEIPCGGVVSF